MGASSDSSDPVVRPVVERVELAGVTTIADVDASIVAAGDRRRLLVALAVMGAVLVLGWMTLASLDPVDDGPGQSAREDSATPEVAVTSVRPTNTAVWPDLPLDHEPHVIRRPGRDMPIDLPDDLTLVYVNSIGRPTIVDLETGAIQEVDISTTRGRDAFGIESGEVVSLSGTSRNIAAAGQGAIVFHVHRTDETIESRSSVAVGERGPHLCLSEIVCSGLEWQPNLISTVATQVERVTPRANPDIAAMLEGEGWDRVNRWLVVADHESTFRLPVPLHGEAWLIADVTVSP
ncbi:MAG: hypothetical protein ACR2P0_20650 [Acidimicrobiales bacterium]